MFAPPGATVNEKLGPSQAGLALWAMEPETAALIPEQRCNWARSNRLGEMVAAGTCQPC
jgi:hypothetical protein